MDHRLQLTARGYAVCELMRDEGLTLEVACEEIEFQLEALRRRVDRIMNDRPWEDVPTAMQAALKGVSLHLQSAYLEEELHSPANRDAAFSA
jgi:hypothetical protein